mgnify:CR=1 FL=1
MEEEKREIKAPPNKQLIMSSKVLAKHIKIKY